MKIILPVVCLAAVVILCGCLDKVALAESSFGKPGHKYSQAGAASVISMGRDDDDGKAKKWHIGGGD